MASRHLKQTHRRPRLTVVIAVASFAIACTAITAALAVHAFTGGGPAARHAQVAAPAEPQSLSQEGRLVAVTPTSVTAQSIDGFARTYVIDAETNAITEHGSLIGGAATAFAVNDEVAIVGVVRDGRAVATAVADKQVSDLNGPPMDAI
jgi:hypothetical protein